MGLLRSFKKTGIPSIFCAVIFLTSGFIVSMLQFATLVIWPVSRKAYRLLNAKLVLLHWTQCVFLAEWWSGTTIRFWGDKADYDASIGKDKGIAVCNHRSDVDWLLGWCIADKWNCLGGTKCLMKDTNKFVPILGWTWWTLEYVFLQRNWEADKSTLGKYYGGLRDFPIPFWVVIFAEGTRLTKTKLADSQEYARKTNQPVLENLLLPRTKGFIHAMTGLRGKIDKVYDVTFAFVGKEPTVLSLMRGEPSKVDIMVRIYDAAALPQTDEGLHQWCKDLWVEKDKLLSHHAQHAGFPGKSFSVQRSTVPAVIFTSWFLAITPIFLRFVYVLVTGGYFITILLSTGLFAAALGFALYMSHAKKGPQKTAAVPPSATTSTTTASSGSKR
eukprot:TRINITY_DN55762_c0_g1_i1.p1 TRINITY_DN55762_c0_g1~~TRINITY_DN55762_c0_g1_i1.p1  ORF type:complete len:395 (-),score=63.52 TRINITY_DN55762_c0_g1_i1:55-1212(-)